LFSIKRKEPVEGKIILNNNSVDYTLRFSPKAKYMRLQVHREKGLQVILPRGYELKEAEAFILRKEDWILKHLAVKPERKRFVYLGNEIKILQSFDLFLKRHKISFREGVLYITSPSSSKDEIKIIFESWLRHLGKKYLTARADQLSRRYGFKFSRIIIRGQKTRWGSCSMRGNISFNYKLMKYRVEVIDYVILHELCHLRQMNHSKNFWALVEQFCPGYKTLKSELKNKK
jgi:hypothetical protein